MKCRIIVKFSPWYYKPYYMVQVQKRRLFLYNYWKDVYRGSHDECLKIVETMKTSAMWEGEVSSDNF